jgi:vitamin B12 transporter
LLYIDAKADYDDDGFDNLINRNHSTMMAGRVGFNLDLMDGRLKNTFSAQGYKIDRDDTNWGGTDNFVGTRQKFDYQGSFTATDWLTLQYGLDHERQEADILASWIAMNASHQLTGVWTQAILAPIDDLVLTLGVRHDEHSEFSGHTTYRGTASYLFADTGTRLHASAGTGFRAPTLFELYDPTYGNPDLKPEKSVSFDIGVEQSLLDGRMTIDLTYFQLAVDDRIGFSGGGYDQVDGTTRSNGVEASFTYAATDWLDLGGSYTYTNSRDPAGSQSLRIPRHAVTLGMVARPAEKWTVSADLKYVADTVDQVWGGPPLYLATVVDLKDYVLLNAKVAYQVNENAEIYIRGENLLDQKYQTAANYGTPGIAAYAGFKAKF